MLFLKTNIKGKKLLKDVKFIKKIDKNKPYVKLGILNLMPNLEDTERDLLQVLENPILQIEIDFIYLKESNNELKNSYLKNNYLLFYDIKNKDYDGFIVTGAPLEHFIYKDIIFNKELKEFLDYTKIHVKSTIFLCFASEIAITPLPVHKSKIFLAFILFAIFIVSSTKHSVSVKRHILPFKLSGLYNNYLINRTNLVKKFNDSFLVPVSRYYGINEKEILLNDNLILVSKGNISGAFIAESKDHKHIFITGHIEYQEKTLEEEYIRDLSKGLNPNIPVNYYINNKINYNWLFTTILYQNWLYYYVLN